MTTTQHAGSVHNVFGIDSFDQVAAAIVGDFADDFDLPGIAHALRRQAQSVLPDGATIHGDDVYVEVGVHLDVEALREAYANLSDIDLDLHDITDPGDVDVDDPDLVVRDPVALRRIGRAQLRIERAQAELANAVRDAFAAGETYAAVARTLGITRQEAQERFGDE